MSSHFAPKVRQWQLATESAIPDSLPTLPSITINDLPLIKRLEVKEWYHIRDWEKCEHVSCRRLGTMYKLMKCAGCGNLPGCRVLYCSKKCQHDDWPFHQRICGGVALRSTMNSAKKACKLGIDATVWHNSHVMSLKRTLGLRLISVGLASLYLLKLNHPKAWVFDQIDINGSINRRETCLSIHFRSSRSGKGYIVPMAFQLEPRADAPCGLPPYNLFDAFPKMNVGVIQLIFDGVYQKPEFIDSVTHGGAGLYIQQWPWVYATIVSMKNYNTALANYRLQHLFPFIDIMARRNIPEVLSFKAPTNLENGKKWTLPDYEKWQTLFGEIVNFWHSGSDSVLD